MSPTLNPSISSLPSLIPSNTPSLSPTITTIPTLSFCSKTEGYSDGTAGNLTLDATTGALTLNGSSNDSRFLTSTTLGLAHDVTTVFDNIDYFVIPAGKTVNFKGTIVIEANGIVIEEGATLDGNGGGYLGAEASYMNNGERAVNGTSPVPNGHGGGGGILSQYSGGGGAGHGECPICLIYFLLGNSDCRFFNEPHIK